MASKEQLDTIGTALRAILSLERYGWLEISDSKTALLLDHRLSAAIEVTQKMLSLGLSEEFVMARMDDVMANIEEEHLP